MPRIAILLTGIFMGAVSGLFKARQETDAAPLKRSIDDLNSKMESQETRVLVKVERLEKRLDEHDAKLKEVPSMNQIVTAMEEMFSSKMDSLDQRISAQVKSIEVLRTTVSQTDELLEQLLETLDSLRPS